MVTRKVLRSGIILAAIFAVVFFAGSGSAMAASKNCSNVGTFIGSDTDLGTTWVVTMTRGQSATVGELLQEWVSITDPTFGGKVSAARLTDAMGVWKKVNGKKFQFTWIAYGFDAGGVMVCAVRASGVGTMTQCDQVELTYVLEFFGPTQDISAETPTYGTVCGAGIQTRMALVQVSCPD